MKRGFLYGVLAASIAWTVALLLPILIPKSVARAVHSYLDISAGPQRADYILVPSGSMFYRLPFAANLLHGHLGDTLVLTVTEPTRWRKESKQRYGLDFSEGSTVRQLLKSSGVADSQVVFLGPSLSTRQDVKLFVDFLAAHSGTATVVSDGCHLRRIRMSFEKHGSPTSDRIRYSASSTFEDLLDRSSEPSDAYQLIYKEWIKYIFYKLGRA